MRLLPFLLVGSAVFVLCHYYWIPVLERRLRSESFIASTRWGSILAFAGFVRGISLINILTMAAVILIVVILQMIGGMSLASTTSAIKAIQQWRTWLAGFGPVWGTGVIIVVVIALGIYARHKGKQRLEPTFNRAFERELKRLEQEREQGQLEELPLTREMEQLQSKILKADRKIMEINWKGSTEPGAAILKQKLTDRLQLLRRRYNMLDVQRRTKLTLDLEALEMSAPRSRWEKVQAFLMTRGLLASLGGGSRLLFWAGFILLVPSLASVYAVIAESMLNDRLVELHDLRGQIDAKEWGMTKEQLGAPTNELSEADKQTLEEAARAFEMAVPIPPPPSSMLKAWYTMHSFAVRQKILERAVRLSLTPLEQHPSGLHISSLDDIERQTVALYENVTNWRGPSTQLGKEIYVKLEDIAKRSPSFMEKIRNSVHDLRKTASIYDIRRAMFTHVMGNLRGASSSELGNLAQIMNLSVNRPLYNLAQQDRARSFIAELIGGRDLTEILRNVGTRRAPRYYNSPFDFAEYQSLMQTFAERLPIDRLNVKTSEYPPSVDALPEKDVDIKTATAKVEDLIKHSRARDRRENSTIYADSLALYQDHFPSQLNVNRRTERSEILDRLGENSPAPIIIDGVEPNRGGGSRGNFLRARNFGALRGFSRVGGVLIGRDPADIETAKLDCTNLEWEIEEGTVRLILTTADGQKFRSKPHRMALLYQAINYAADGRPVAVTMVNAEPMPELKVLLHPTLIDTPLGYRMIELDGFVGYNIPKYKTEWENARDSVYAQEAIYEYAWAYRLRAALSLSGPDKEWEIYLKGIIENSNTRSLVSRALSEAELLRDPKHSPLTVKKEFFDPTLVDLILNNASRDVSPELFGQAVYNAALSQYKQVINNESERTKLFKRWEQSPPTFIVWSGVREREFTSDPASLMILDGSSATLPFDFMMQIAFTSPPLFADGTQSESHNDSQPWEFPSLKKLIQDRVIDSVMKDEQWRTILDDTIEFAILQRLFRMAFNGHLGMDFPVEKLVILSEIASARAPKKITRTLRWVKHSDPTDADDITTRLEGEIRRALRVDKDVKEEIKRGYRNRLPAIDP